MTSKDASNSRSEKVRQLISLAGGAVAVLAVCLAARSFWGLGSATAQAPSKRGVAPRPVATPNSRTNTRPATQATAQIGNATQWKVMAAVNGQQVTREALARECLRRYGQDVLESIVNKHLIWQACQKQGIRITDADVETEIEEQAGNFGLPKDKWLTMLETERDISADRYRRELIWPMLALRRLASEQIVVTEEELIKQLETEHGPRVRARMIMATTQQKATRAHQRAKAAPDKFGNIAKELSEDANSAAARGIIPPIRKNLGNAEIERAAFSLRAGEVSQIIPVGNQYIILKCEKQIQPPPLSSKTLPRIKAQLRDRIRDGKLSNAATQLFKELQAESKVVNVFNDQKLRQQLPGVAATINGRRIPMQQLSDECLLRYGKEVLEGEINRAILTQELKRQNKSVTQPAIDEEIARAADSYGYIKKDNTPDVQAWLKTVTESDNVSVDLYVYDAVWPSVALKQIVRESVQVTQEDLQKGFESNYGERVEVLAIVLNNQRQANEVWDMARNNPTEQYFGELANLYSIEQVSRANFGKVPPIRQHGGQPIIENEAFRLKPGGVESLSGILNVGDKYIILKCLGYTKPKVTNFETVKDELYKDIHEKKLRIAMAEEFDRLKESAQIDNFLAGTSQSKRKLGPASRTAKPVGPAGFQAPRR
ncbi:MAG: peptidylprolyl isomerase [Planctomycetaceae bacterium]|nr:peptidylprolyl isomerase [Planctomycetaceae bacterium]